MPQAVRETRLRCGTASFVGGDAQVAISPPATSTSAPPTAPATASSDSSAPAGCQTSLDGVTDEDAPDSGKVTAAQVQDELHRFMKAVLSPKKMLVVQPRRKMAHEIGVPEDTTTTSRCGAPLVAIRLVAVLSCGEGFPWTRDPPVQALLPGTDG